MKCPKCGKEVANDSNFCEFCGAKVKQQGIQLWSRCSTWQKVTITLLVLWFLFGSWHFANNYYYYEYYEDAIVFWSMVLHILSTGILITAILLKSSLNSLPVAVSPPDGKKPGALFTFIGIGQAILCAFKFRKVDDTYVSYTFFMFLLPLFPTGCYRVRLLDSEVGFFNKQQWNIYGSEKTNWKEIAYIYMIMYGFIVWVLSMWLILG